VVQLDQQAPRSLEARARLLKQKGQGRAGGCLA
jgi:hypothetical protein